MRRWTVLRAKKRERKRREYAEGLHRMACGCQQVYCIARKLADSYAEGLYR